MESNKSRKVFDSAELAQKCHDPKGITFYHEGSLKAIEIEYLNKFGEEEKKFLGSRTTASKCDSTYENFQPKSTRLIREVTYQVQQGSVQYFKVVIEDTVKNSDVVREFGKLSDQSTEEEWEALSIHKFLNEDSCSNFSFRLEFEQADLASLSVQFHKTNDLEIQLSYQVINSAKEGLKYADGYVNMDKFFSSFPREGENVSQENLEFFSKALVVRDNIKNLQKEIYHLLSDITAADENINDLVLQSNNTFEMNVKNSQGNFHLSKIQDLQHLVEKLDQGVKILQGYMKQARSLLQNARKFQGDPNISALMNKILDIDKFKQYTKAVAAKYMDLQKFESSEQEKRKQIVWLEADTASIQKQLDVVINNQTLIDDELKQLQQQQVDLNKLFKENNGALEEYSKQIKTLDESNLNMTMQQQSELCNKKKEEAAKESEERCKYYEREKQNILSEYSKLKGSVSKFNKIHFIMIFDVSGSMSGHMNDLIEAHNGIKQFYESFRNRHQFSVVLFGTGAEIHYKKEPASEMKAIPGRLMGGTNFKAAIDIGLQLVKAEDQGYTSVIIFFTDGEDGSNERYILNELERQKNAHSSMMMFTIAFGTSSINQSFLQQMVMTVNKAERFLVNGEWHEYMMDAKNAYELVKAFAKINNCFKIDTHESLMEKFDTMIQQEKKNHQEEIKKIDDTFQRQSNLVKQQNEFLKDLVSTSHKKSQEEMKNLFQERNQTLEQQQKLCEQKKKELLDQERTFNEKKDGNLIDIEALQNKEISERRKAEIQADYEQRIKDQNMLILKQKQITGFVNQEQFENFKTNSYATDEICISLSNILQTLISRVQSQIQGLEGVVQEMKQIFKESLQSIVSDEQIKLQLLNKYSECFDNYKNPSILELREVVGLVLESEHSDEFSEVKVIFTHLKQRLNFLQIVESQNLDDYMKQYLWSGIKLIPEKAKLDDSDEEENPQSTQDDIYAFDKQISLLKLRTQSQVSNKIAQFNNQLKKLKAKLKETPKEKKKERNNLRSLQLEYTASVEFLNLLLNDKLLQERICWLVQMLKTLLAPIIMEIAREEICKKIGNQLAVIIKVLIPKTRCFIPIKEIVGVSKPQDFEPLARQLKALVSEEAKGRSHLQLMSDDQHTQFQTHP